MVKVCAVAEIVKVIFFYHSTAMDVWQLTRIYLQSWLFYVLFGLGLQISWFYIYIIWLYNVNLEL